MSSGKLVVQLYTAGGAYPVSGAVVTVSALKDGKIIFQEKDTVDLDGKTKVFDIETPPFALSLEENCDSIPYSTVEVSAQSPVFETEITSGIQVFADREALMLMEMLPLENRSSPSTSKVSVYIPPHHLTDKNASALPPKLSGDNFILDRAYVPDEITVHLGPPREYAENVRVPFIDYIKNVASSEIYPTWPENSLRANIYAQISLALNRIYTEWYRSRGYGFDISGSPSYDQAYTRGRNIFDNVSQLVDDVFNTFLRKTNREEPYFAEYCDGKTVSCPGMSQWGTVSLAKKGMSPLEILRYYYGNDIIITTTNLIGGIPKSYPGTPIRLGDMGRNISNIQIQLNRIGRNYPNIPLILPVNGVFGDDTELAVKAFQSTFNLVSDGIVGKGTWYKLSYIYVSVKKLAELTSEGETIAYAPGKYPGYPLTLGMENIPVSELQYYLRVVGAYYDEIPVISMDGFYGRETRDAVIAFQNLFDLKPDGITGRNTWNKIYSEYVAIQKTVPLPSEPAPYPGKPLRAGSRGNSVKRMQIYLHTLRVKYPSLPQIIPDGVFGSETRRAVIIFQKANDLTADGIIGRDTWDDISDQYYNLQGR